MHQRVAPPGAVGSSYDESCYLVCEALNGPVEPAPCYSTHHQRKLPPALMDPLMGILFPIVCSLLPTTLAPLSTLPTSPPPITPGGVSGAGSPRRPVTYPNNSLNILVGSALEHKMHSGVDVPRVRKDTYQRLIDLHTLMEEKLDI